jgi:hypothetical protein
VALVGRCIRTLIVKVASTPDAAAVALVFCAGIVLPLLPSTASLLRRRVCPNMRDDSLGAEWPKALGRRAANDVNISSMGVGYKVKAGIKL